MQKTKEILRLKYEFDLGLRDIAKSCNCSLGTVHNVLERAKKANVTWPIIDLSDKQLGSLIYPPSSTPNTQRPEPNLEYIFFEMKKKGVTLMLLWEEYKEQYPDGIMYTQFCQRYRNFFKSNNLYMHIDHKAGDEMQVDWAGQKMFLTEPSTGEIIDVYIFVAVMPASNYVFAKGYIHMKKPTWINAHIEAYEYYGGVPMVTVPDNTKTAVTTPEYYDPHLNRSYAEMGVHYGTAIVPTRVRSPKDKSAVEKAVKDIETHIIAALRKERFFSLTELNNAISDKLRKFNTRPFQKIQGNRLDFFHRIDKPALRPLPACHYEYADWKEVKVGFDYHVEYDNGFFYSVHYSYAGQKAFVRATSSTVEVFVDGERVSVHPRNYNEKDRYKTTYEHMPEKHKAVSDWSPKRFLKWATKIGPYTKQYIKNVLESRDFPQQAYRTCAGILSLGNDISKDQMEMTCQEALEKKIISYKYFNMLLKTRKVKPLKEPQVSLIIKHSNIRGNKAFGGDEHVK